MDETLKRPARAVAGLGVATQGDYPLKLFCSLVTPKLLLAKAHPPLRQLASDSFPVPGRVVTERGSDLPDAAFPPVRWQDPIFSLATPLRAGEEGSHSRKSLSRSREDAPPGDQSAPLSSAPPILGGWFGRGCAKRAKRKKAA